MQFFPRARSNARVIEEARTRDIATQVEQSEHALARYFGSPISNLLALGWRRPLTAKPFDERRCDAGTEFRRLTCESGGALGEDAGQAADFGSVLRSGVARLGASGDPLEDDRPAEQRECQMERREACSAGGRRGIVASLVVRLPGQA
jgi:hypothetical protein